MPFVKRDNSGNVTILSEHKSLECAEYVDPHSEDIRTFIESNTSIAVSHDVLTKLQNSDTELARVTEDLVYLLVSKKVIMFTELPTVVQEKLLSRERLRASLNQSTPNLMDDEGSV